MGRLGISQGEVSNNEVIDPLQTPHRLALLKASNYPFREETFGEALIMRACSRGNQAKEILTEQSDAYDFMNQNKLANGLLTCSWATSIRHSYHVIVLDVHCFWSETVSGLCQLIFRVPCCPVEVFAFVLIF